MFDILNELDSNNKRLRGVSVGGYVTKRIPKPPIFTSEIIEDNCKFVEMKVVYVGLKGSRRVSAGNIAVLVPKDLEESDFYEFKGNLTLGSLDYTRLVTFMNFKKSTNNSNKTIWLVKPVEIQDIELTKLNKEVHNELLRYVESPLGYQSESTKYLLKPVAETIVSSKVFYDFKGLGVSSFARDLPTNKTSDFEEQNNYLIDKEYEILREGLRFRVLALNITEFGNDSKLLKYVRWLVDGNIEVVSSLLEVKDDDNFYLVLTSENIDKIPYIELKKGVMVGWEL